MEILDVKKQKAIIAYQNADSKGKQLLVDLFGKEVFSMKITDRVKTFADACKHTGDNPDNAKFYLGYIDEMAYKKLKVIVKVLNEGWTPNWRNTDEPKWFPYFEIEPNFNFIDVAYNTWNSCSHVGSHLCFRSRDLAYYAGHQFVDLYQALLK